MRESELSKDVRKGSDFWDALVQQLGQVATNPIVSETIMQSLKERLQYFISTLSLDEIERIAVMMENTSS